uniref:Anthocyanin bHLH transcriptional regulator n=1 Tax=Ipomoea batatas TaxID=4120 RepID=A0A7D7FJP4_IPOBA|nr:anthocyanin bHLH transcriptional regulator [Ipomoea batatas]
MAAENPVGSGRLETLLQTAVQSVQWTYSLFWKLCPHNGMLVWSDGYYNGAIKTRKTVQGTEVSAGEASLHRSQQIKELYESLSSTAEESNGGSAGQQPPRRPSAALSPEDLTESEWFYLMCISFSFPSALGLPGKAYAKRQHIWLTGANEVESKVFSRAILAKSARIQTVVCIPLMDGVVELGTTERVKEDYEFIQLIKNHFMEPHPHHHHHHPKPALSEHSSSEPPSQQLHSPVMASGHHRRQDRAEEEDEEEEEEEDDEEDEEEELQSDADVSPKNQQTGDHVMAAAPEEEGEENINGVVAETTNVAAASELMQFEMSESIRLGTPDDASTDLDSDFLLLPQMPHCQNPNFLSHQGAPIMEEFSREETHYSETISSILRHQCGQWSEFSTTVAGDYVAHSATSAFSSWTTAATSTCSTHRSSAQWILKYALLTVPFLHEKNSHVGAGAADATIPSSKLCKAAPQEEPNANHVLAERRRREKLNERFIILRSLVPFVTKMDKASILGDTIEYVKQLRRRIQELEAARGSAWEVDRHSITGGVTRKNPAQKCGASRTLMGPTLRKRGMRTAERPANDTAEDAVVQVEVSIIESDALVEIRCTYREGLILDVMQMLRELGLEITTVQSSVNGGIFCAELRAKLKENLKGRKATIMEVKKAIHSIIPQF